MKESEIAKLFSYHPPMGTQTGRYADLLQAGYVLAVKILDRTPASPEQTLAIRKVEEAIMWANAAIAINEEAVPAALPADQEGGPTP